MDFTKAQKSIADVFGMGQQQYSVLEKMITREDICLAPYLEKPVAELLKQISDREKFGTEVGLKGLLLTGRQGTGKTLLAQFIATETESDLLYMESIPSAAVVSEVFNDARERYQSTGKTQIIFVDELDEYGKRNDLITDPFKRQIINAICRETDGVHTNEGVLFFGATNYALATDSALRDRFSETLRVLSPDEKTRLAILNMFVQKYHEEKFAAQRKEGDLRKGHIFTSSPDILEKIAAELHGYTPRDIKRLVNKAFRKANNEDRTEVTYLDFSEARKEITPSGVSDLPILTPRKELSELAGLDEVIGQILDVLDRVKEGPVKFLLHGPSGSGKDAVAEAIAKRLGYPYIVPTAGDFLHGIVGSTEHALQDAFESADLTAPCVLHMSEINYWVESRQQRGVIYHDTWTGQFRNCMDRLRNRVIVFATAPNDELFDKQVKRRFDEILELRYPSLGQGTLAVFDIYMNKYSPDEWKEFRTAKHTGIADLPIRVEDFFASNAFDSMSGAEIEVLCKKIGTMKMRLTPQIIEQSVKLAKESTRKEEELKLGYGLHWYLRIEKQKQEGK